MLDKNINLLGVIDNYESFSITRRFFECGEFEFKINSNKLHTDKLVKNNLILLGKDYNKVGLILHREFVYGEGGQEAETLLIKGIMIQGLSKRRIIIPDIGQEFDSCIGNQETIMKYFVYKSCISPTDLNRKIDNLIIAVDKKRGENDRWRGAYESLDEKLKEIGEYSNLGWNIVLDHKQKKFIFDVMQGKDLTVNQNTNPPVIFRSDFNNIKTRHYTESIINSRNSLYIGSKEKLVLNLGDITGFERMETFLDSTSEEVEDIKKEGLVKLEEIKELKTFELEINPNNTFVYEKDYDLGDIVTIQDKKLKVTMDSRIVEAQEVYSNDGMKLKATFGTRIPSLLAVLKRMVK
ncbi:siphovirus ReqiPepy6 Gp37-like family protein [Clostridium botulinum]